MKADRTIKAALGRLKLEREVTKDRVLLRVVQAIEYGIQWSRQDVRGWPYPIEEAEQLAKLIRQEQTK